VPILSAMPESEYDRIARTLAHLAAAWRDHGDLEILAGLPDGLVDIDILAGSAGHESAGPIPLRLAAELRAALADRLARKGIDPRELQAAELRLRVDTGGILTDRARIVHFDFDWEARLRAAGQEYRAARREDHVWHDREPDRT
jgi:hypothetical protein